MTAALVFRTLIRAFLGLVVISGGMAATSFLPAYFPISFIQISQMWWKTL